FNRLKWANGFTQAPEWQEQPLPYWGELVVNPSFYDLNNGRITAPQLTGSDRVRLSRQGSRLMMAMARKIGGTQFLWNCHQIGVNSAGNNDDGQADRSAIQWFRIQTTPTISITERGGKHCPHPLHECDHRHIFLKMGASSAGIHSRKFVQFVCVRVQSAFNQTNES